MNRLEQQYTDFIILLYDFIKYMLFIFYSTISTFVMKGKYCVSGWFDGLLCCTHIHFLCTLYSASAQAFMKDQKTIELTEHVFLVCAYC